MPSAQNELEIDIEVVIDVARQAGQLVLDMRRAGLRSVRNKSSDIDLVTEADVASEHLIRHALGKAFPEIDFWGEESDQPPNAAYFWVVDPIDGTTNYANGLPSYAVNIALNHRETTLLGVTLELPVRRVYWARQGAGAYRRELDGSQTRLRVSEHARLGSALLATGFPYHRSEHDDNNSVEFVHFLARAQGVRCTGSAAMDLAHVAEGSLAGYWEGWLKPWDAAAGALLVREAGGSVTDYSAAPWVLTCNSLIASNGQSALHQALVEGVQQARSTLEASLLPALPI